MEAEIEWQGYTEDDKRFGYIAGSDGGGWFFVECARHSDTLQSLEIDEIDGDGGMSYETAYKILYNYLRE